ncbi:MAG: ATP-binding cassette domain-containing protein [bacterium]
MSDIVLELRDVVKTFPGVRALDGAQLSLRAGECHGLVGENGAGKSTLMNVAGGVCQPDAGSILPMGSSYHLLLRNRRHGMGWQLCFRN